MLQNEFQIGARRIAAGGDLYVIAEVGSNFNQSLDQARRMIDVAAESGANAVKFQLFRADILYPTGELNALFKSIELKADWIPILNKHAADRGLQLLASAFDRESVDVLEAAGVPAHKIASSETANLPLLHYIASKGKPLVISTGMCDMVDVEEAVNVCLGAGNGQIALLQCGAMYPLPAELANLNVIPALAERFKCPVGFSDHTLGSAAGAAAVGLGATVFEKHFTLDRASEGPDHSYALEPGELNNYIATLVEAHRALGSREKEMLPQERAVGRREGLFAARDLVQGEVIAAKDFIMRRPATGLRARYASTVAGARVARNVAKDEPLSWDTITFGGTK